VTFSTAASVGRMVRFAGLEAVPMLQNATTLSESPVPSSHVSSSPDEAPDTDAPDGASVDRVDVDRPLRTDIEIAALVASLLERANRRQCWLMFLTAERTPIELVIPIEELPYEPDTEVRHFAGTVRDIVDRCRAAFVIVVWERPGGPDPLQSEQLWIESIARNFGRRGITVRAQLIVHDDGVAVVDVDAACAAAAELIESDRAVRDDEQVEHDGAEPDDLAQAA
jgi:hypothetical protein